jgi:hypothetical protein
VLRTDYQHHVRFFDTLLNPCCPTHWRWAIHKWVVSNDFDPVSAEPISQVFHAGAVTARFVREADETRRGHVYESLQQPVNLARRCTAPGAPHNLSRAPIDFSALPADRLSDRVVLFGTGEYTAVGRGGGLEIASEAAEQERVGEARTVSSLDQAFDTS